MLILKSKIIVTVISILVITVFVGCEKDLLNSNNPNTLQEVQDLTNRYFENNNTKAKPKGKIWAAVCRIAGKDISGAVTGAGVGAAAGAAIGGAAGGVGALHGATTGAIVGGVAGGVGASLFQLGEEIGGGKGSKQLISYSSNPYDCIGDIHADILNIAFSNSTVFFENNSLINDSVFIYSCSMLTKKGLLSDSLTYYEINDINNTIDYVENYYDNEDLESILIRLHNDKLISSDILTLLKEYFSVIYIMGDYSVFYDYSIEFEDIIINASDINDIDKIIILLTASTCRYDIDFWIDNINNI